MTTPPIYSRAPRRFAWAPLLLALAACSTPTTEPDPGAGVTAQPQAQGIPPRVVDQPEADAAPMPEDPADWTSPCLGPDWRAEDPLPPTPDACDPHAAEGVTNLYAGRSAIKAMRACDDSPGADRRPFEMLQIADAVLDAWPADTPRYLLQLPHPGVRLLVHTHLIDDVTRCADLPMGDIWLGDGITRAGETFGGTIELSYDADRLIAAGNVTYQILPAWPAPAPAIHMTTGIRAEPLQ